MRTSGGKIHRPARDDARRILLVEDDEDDARALQAAFDEAGSSVNVVRAAGIAPARRLVADGRFDLAIVDLSLGDGTGFDFLRENRARLAAQGTRLVVLTGSDRPDDIALARRLGADGYFLKPRGFAEYLGLARDLAVLWAGSPLEV